MGSLNHLEEIFFQINNLILENMLLDEDELLGSFKILGALYLTSCAEKYKLIEPNLSFKKKISKISRAFPILYEIDIYDKFSQIYPKIIEIRNKFGNKVGLDPLGNLYQKILTKTAKQGKGIVFTPISIIKYILHQIGFPNRYSIKDKQNIIDLSSGSGLFLAQAIDVLIEQNIEKFTVNEIIDYIQNNVIGFDIDPLAVYISKFNLSLKLIERFKERYNLETSFTPNIYLTNSLAKQGEEDIDEVKKAKNQHYDFVVGNPPYIEAKRMDKLTKKICLLNYPKAARGHFDVYSCFLELGTDLLKDNGKLGYIIPSKFLSSRYSKEMRRYFLEHNLISEIVDLTHQNVFRPAVYPVILILDKTRLKEEAIKLANNVDYEELQTMSFKSKCKYVSADFFYKTTNKTIFLPDSTSLSIIEKIYSDSEYRLGDLVRFRWSISFHRRGLREHFVFEKPVSTKSRKFLGGKPFGGNREVERYGINWKGYYLDYNHEKAKRMKNNFPEIDIFISKKIIICQHALRMRATLDAEGYICKDIFLLGHLTQKARDLNISLELILSLLNSELFSFMYSIMYSSTEITGKYLHYLPMYLHDLPFIIPDDQQNELLIQKVILLLEQEQLNPVLDEEVDSLVYGLFKVDEKERKYAKKHINQYLVK